MRLYVCTTCTIAMQIFFIGCSGTIEEEARNLVVPASMPGRAMENLIGSAEDLIAKGRIDLHLSVPSLDGIETDVWVIQSRLPALAGADGKPARNTRGTVILIHPLLLSKAHFLSLGELLAKRGWDVILPDLRAHGRSGGQYVTWGYLEKYDVRAAVDDLVLAGKVSDRLYVVGSSLGGAVAIQYAATDSRCRGVLALAPPASFREISKKMLWTVPDWDHDEILQEAGMLARFDPDKASAVDAAGKLTSPLIIVHGTLDLVVPIEHSQAIFSAARGPRRFIRLFAGHSIEVGREKWLAERIDELTGMAEKAGPPGAPPG